MSGDRLTRRLLGAGLVGPPLFVAVFLVDGATRPGYDPTYHPVSALSLGDRGWIQIGNFVLTGLLAIGFAVGVRRVLRTGPAARSAPLLIGAYGLALLLSGVFPMDPMRGYPPGVASAPAAPSWQHTVHDNIGAVVFTVLPVAALVLARRFARRPDRRGWAGYSLATGVAGLALLVWFGVSWEADAPAAGLIQRIMIVVDWTWWALLAVRLRADAYRTGG